RRFLIVRLYLVHFVVLGAIASTLGCMIGYVAQFVLARWLGSFLAVTLPWPGLFPAWHGLAAGVLLLLGFALPPLISLGQVSTLRVLRRDLGVPRGLGALGYVLGLALICALVLWKAHDIRLGAYVIGGFLAAAALSVVLVLALLRLSSRLRAAGSVGFSYGLANLRRHALGNTIQVVALALGMMALLTLTLIRGDLLRSWQATLRPDAPNRFVISMQPDHRIVAGRWWTEGEGRTDQLSLEDGIAVTLGLKLNDRLTYDVAGSKFDAVITSLRKVEWDTFKANFFVIAPPKLLQSFPVSYMTSLYVP